MTHIAANTITWDRRAATRYPVRDKIFITFRPAFDVVGCLVDLSHDGLAFEYTAFEHTQRDGDVQVDLFCQPRQLNLTRIPCRIIYIQERRNAPSFCGFRTKRCGLQFGQISWDQAEHIRSLLRAYRAASETRE